MTATAGDVFVPLVGQEDNIGDVVLRRGLVRALRPIGRLHVYVGDVSRDFLEALDLGPDDVVYRSLGSWIRAALGLRAGRGLFLMKPGEIQLSPSGLKEPLGLLPVILWLRWRGVPIARVGVGTRQGSRLALVLSRPAARLATLLVWRDAYTRDLFGRGSVAPDLAFAEGDDLLDERGPRHRLVLSARGDRPLPSRTVVAALETYAQNSGLTVTVVTQVARDESRTRELAARFAAADVISWDGQGHVDHEDRLRQAYSETVVAVSDRLHVLVAAATEGAAPLCLQPGLDVKIDRHFRAAGMADVCVDVTNLSSGDVERHLQSAGEMRDNRSAQVTAARRRLADVVRDLRNLTGGDHG